MRTKISRRFFVLFGFDLAAAVFSVHLAVGLRSGDWSLSFFHVPFFYALIAILPVLFYIFDLYFPYKLFAPSKTLVDVLVSVGIGMALVASISYLDKSFLAPRSIFVFAGAGILVLVFLSRMIYDFIFKSRILDKKTLVLGTTPMAYQVAELIKSTPHAGMDIVGMVSEDRKKTNRENQSVPILGNISNLLSLIDWYGVRHVVLAMDPNEEASETQIMADLLKKNVDVISSIHLFEKLTGDVPYESLDPHYLLGLMAQIKARPYLKLKRVLDVFISLGLIVVFLPVLTAVAILSVFYHQEKIFFFQDRIGKDGVPFRLIKLRSMKTSSGAKLRITRLGLWMRKYRIDEVPQLVNVLKGDMSLVGPRPEIPYFVERCRKKIPFYDMVFAVKPGITGWAQVRFHYTTSQKDYEKKFRYNLYYLKNISLPLDLLILLQTVRIVLFGMGK